MKLNKSEQELLDEVTRNPWHYVGIDHGCQGPSGRKRHFGVRRHNAAVSLMKKGLLKLVPGSQSQSWLYKNGWGINGVVYSSQWQLVESVQSDAPQAI